MRRTAINHNATGMTKTVIQRTPAGGVHTQGLSAAPIYALISHATTTIEMTLWMMRNPHNPNTRMDALRTPGAEGTK